VSMTFQGKAPHMWAHPVRCAGWNTDEEDGKR
jgi:hypothetical protein